MNRLASVGLRYCSESEDLSCDAILPDPERLLRACHAAHVQKFPLGAHLVLHDLQTEEPRQHIVFERDRQPHKCIHIKTAAA